MFITILVFLFILGILVLVNELGHFLTAKKFGLKPHEFGIGYKPRLWGIYKSKEGGWKQVRGNGEVHDAVDTIYSINALPIGGFVSKPSTQGKVWQIIQLIDKNTLNKRPFEEERDIIRSDIIKAELDKEISRLLENASIKVHKPEGIVIDRVWSQGE